MKVTETDVAEEVIKAEIALRKIKATVYSNKHDDNFKQVELTLMLMREMVHLLSHVNVHSMREAAVDYNTCVSHNFGKNL